MGKITALTAQTRNPDRVNVHIDGEFAFGLAYAAAAKLRINQELSQPEIDTLKRQDTIEKAKDSAYRLISLRPRSSAEIQQNLNRKGYDAEVIAQVITDLCESDLLNDKAFAQYWVEQRDTFKPRSHLALRQELQQKGISRNLIDEVLTDSDESNAARMAAEKKARQLSHLSETDFKKKLGQFLQRRGFNYDLTKEIVEEMWRQSASAHLLENDESDIQLPNDLSG
jgi:regulatory protein